MRTWIAAVVAAVTLLAATGCGGGDDGAVAESQATTAPAMATEEPMTPGGQTAYEALDTTLTIIQSTAGLIADCEDNECIESGLDALSNIASQMTPEIRSAVSITDDGCLRRVGGQVESALGRFTDADAEWTAGEEDAAVESIVVAAGQVNAARDELDTCPSA